MVQAEDRAHRLGQKNCVDCHYLIGADTLDEILYLNLQKKLQLVSNILDGKQNKLNAYDLIFELDPQKDFELLEKRKYANFEELE